MATISSASHSNTSRVLRHQGNQLNRIQKGLGDGSLTAGEAGGLVAQQGRIAKAESRALADGSMDRKEFKQLRKMQRGASRDIFEQRHNASRSPVGSSGPGGTPCGGPAGGHTSSGSPVGSSGPGKVTCGGPTGGHPSSESPEGPSGRGACVDTHQDRQRNRIQNGLGDGSLTAGEAGGLIDQQTRIAEAKGRALADGTMDEAEYSQLRQLQREASRSIFDARHNCGIRA